MGLYSVPRHAGVRGNEIADKLTRDGSVQKFTGPEPSMGGLYAEHKKEDKMLGGHHHLAMWCGPSSTQRQTRKLIMDPSPTTKTRLLYFDRTQSRVVIGLLNGHNTLRRHLYLKGLINAPYAGGVVQRKKPHSTFCVSVKSWLHSDMHIWVLFSWTQRILTV